MDTIIMGGVRVVPAADAAGRTVVANQPFEPGDVVLQDHPLITWDNVSMEDYIKNYCDADADAKAKILDMAHLDLDSENRFPELQETAKTIATSMQRLYPECNKELVYRLLHIKRTNAHSFGCAACPTRGALFHTASKCNHSCSPNVIYSTLGDKMQLTALRPIDINEAVCPSYLSDLLVLPFQQRRAKLLHTKDFLCACPRCSDSDDCRGIRCLTSSSTRAKMSKTNICNGVAFRRNVSRGDGEGGGGGGLWVCAACGAESSDDSMALALHAERDLEAQYSCLEEKFTVATTGMSPEEFSDLEKAISRVGFSGSHYLSVKTKRLYVQWCAGQSKSLVDSGVDPRAQVMSPWGSVCSAVSFLVTAVEQGTTVTRLLECVGVSCSDGERPVIKQYCGPNIM